MGGKNVIHVSHGSFARPLGKSTTTPSVGYLASGGYLPNDTAGKWFIRKVWPLVLAKVPNCTLHIFGFDTEKVYGWVRDSQITVHGAVSDLDRMLGDTSVLAGPVVSGAGAQMKVVTALAHSRSMVVTPHTLESVPVAVRDLVTCADSAEGFAEALVALLTDHNLRWHREAELRARHHEISWYANLLPLASYLAGMQTN